MTGKYGLMLLISFIAVFTMLLLILNEFAIGFESKLPGMMSFVKDDNFKRVFRIMAILLAGYGTWRILKNTWKARDVSNKEKALRKAKESFYY